MYMYIFRSAYLYSCFKEINFNLTEEYFEQLSNHKQIQEDLIMTLSDNQRDSEQRSQDADVADRIATGPTHADLVDILFRISAESENQIQGIKNHNRYSHECIIIQVQLLGLGSELEDEDQYFSRLFDVVYTDSQNIEVLQSLNDDAKAFNDLIDVELRKGNKRFHQLLHGFEKVRVAQMNLIKEKVH